MNKQEFDDLFVAIKQKISAESEEDIIARLSPYAKDPEHMKLEEIITCVHIETIKYTNDLVYNLLLATVIEPD